MVISKITAALLAVALCSMAAGSPAAGERVLPAAERLTVPPNDEGGIGNADCCTLRGDLDMSGTVNVADINPFVLYLFKGGSPSDCPIHMDVDDSWHITLSDLTYLVGYLFKSGPPPVACD